ncbi:ATP-binding protein [Polyangium sp. 6x1]|nr:ATP-binding protein [Polyangium sp. 6x1]
MIRLDPMRRTLAVANASVGEGEAERTIARRKLEQTIGAAYLVAILAALVIGGVASFALQSVIASQDRVEEIYGAELLEVERLRTGAMTKASQGRAYLLTGDPEMLEASYAARHAFETRLGALLARTEDPAERARIERVATAQKAHQEALARAFALHRAGGTHEDVGRVVAAEVIPKLGALGVAIDDYELFVDSRLEVARDNARRAATRSSRLVVIVACAAVLLAAGLGVLLTRTMHRLYRAAEERLALFAREERARAEAEEARRNLAETVERLSRVNEDLDAFAGRIAHDLRNLLTPIALVPPRLRRAEGKEATERIATSLERSVTRANAVLEGLLAFSRSSRPDDTSQKASVREVVAEVAEELAQAAAEARVDVTVHVEDTRVACSPELLHVVVLNLLGNALKYIAGSAERRVSIRAARADGGFVELAVEDTGPGIPDGAKDRIFEPFYRVPGVRAPGTGIGLATVRRIVTAHEGRIECVSTLGRGTTFRVWIPCAERTTQNPCPAPAGRGMAGASAPLSREGEGLG